MKTSTRNFAKFSSLMMPTSLLVLLILANFKGVTQTLTPDFVSAGYVLTDLGSIDQLPAQYGGLTIRPEQPNTLYIGGNANTGSGALYSVALIRDPQKKKIKRFWGGGGK